MGEPIYIEAGTKWSYAVALEWPGWARHARGRADPVEALIDVAPRYRDALALSGFAFTPPSGVEAVDVIEVVEGNSVTEWGVPSVVVEADRRPLGGAETERLAAILEAAWLKYDMTVDGAAGHELRRGPRGGGRQLDALVKHCLEADFSYLGKLGSRKPNVEGEDPRAIEAAIRVKALEAFRDRAAGRPVKDPNRVSKLWLPRFYVRYVAWHTLVHAWEIEDRLVD